MFLGFFMLSFVFLINRLPYRDQDYMYDFIIQGAKETQNVCPRRSEAEHMGH